MIVSSDNDSESISEYTSESINANTSESSNLNNLVSPGSSLVSVPLAGISGVTKAPPLLPLIVCVVRFRFPVSLRVLGCRRQLSLGSKTLLLRALRAFALGSAKWFRNGLKLPGVVNVD